MKGNTWRGMLQVAVAAGLWGAAYPLTKGVLGRVPPVMLGCSRFFLATLLLMIWTRSTPLGGISAQDRPKMLWLGFWGAFVLVLGMNFGLKWAPGTASSIISGTPPLFTVFLAAAWLGEPLRPRHFGALALALPGLFLLTGDASTPGQEGWKTWVGILLIVIPQIAWAIYGVLGKAIIHRYPWPIVCRDTFAMGSLLLLPFAVIETRLVGWGSWDLPAVLTLGYLGFFNSMVTYGLWNSALALIPVSTASFVLYLQPVTGAVLSAILFGERLGQAGWLGTGLIFAALAIVLRPIPERTQEGSGV